MKGLAYSAFFVNVILFGTYYAVSKEALQRIDPVVFACAEMFLLVPVALALVLFMRSDLTREVWTRGSLLGGCFCGVLVLLAVALQHTSATATAFFPCLNGILAALFSWLVLRRSISNVTWAAAILAVLGMLLMMADSPLHGGEWRGNLLAFLGAVLYTGFIFLFDTFLVGYETSRPTGFWPVLGVQLLTMGGGAAVLVLLFGDWHGVHPSWPKDLWALLYVGLFIVLLPLILAAYLQGFVSATTVAFIYILEPVTGALTAFLYLHEVFSARMYVGQGLVLCGVLLQMVLGLKRGTLVDGGKGRHTLDPTRSPKHGRKPQRWLLLGLPMAVILAGLSALLGTSTWPVSAPSRPSIGTPHLTQTKTPTAQISPMVGSAYFVSSGQLDDAMMQGSNDELLLELHGAADPTAGKAYYGWLLQDRDTALAQPILLGKLMVTQGEVRALYQDPTHTDVLATISRVLVTEEDARVPPLNPSLDPQTWRYYGEIAQRPNPAESTYHYSLLDHIRHLLVGAPLMSDTMHMMPLPGSLRIWFLLNTRDVLEWASAARGSSLPEAPPSLRIDLYRILDELDGSALVPQDVPTGTPLYVDPQVAQVPLLQVQPGQKPPGYVTQIGLHLAAIAQSPDATPEQRQIAIRVTTDLNLVADALGRVRESAKQLILLSDAQLAQPSALSLLDDLVEQATSAYAGVLNPATGEREGGALRIADQLERLATIGVLRCSPCRI